MLLIVEQLVSAVFQISPCRHFKLRHRKGRRGPGESHAISVEVFEARRLMTAYAEILGGELDVPSTQFTSLSPPATEVRFARLWNASEIAVYELSDGAMAFVQIKPVVAAGAIAAGGDTANGVAYRASSFIANIGSGGDWLDNYANWYANEFGEGGEIATSVATGVVVGAVTTGVIIVAAPLAVSAGAGVLVAAGATAATATTVATATVTGTLFVAGTVGAVGTTINTAQAVNAGNWNQVGFNVGTVVGGFAVSSLGGGQYLVTGMTGQPSAAPNTWNPLPLLAYELANVYQPKLGPWYSPTYWATAPTPLSGGFTAAASFGLFYFPDELGP